MYCPSSCLQTRINQLQLDGSSIEDLCLDFTLPGHDDIPLKVLWAVHVFHCLPHVHVLHCFTSNYSLDAAQLPFHIVDVCRHGGLLGGWEVIDDGCQRTADHWHPIDAYVILLGGWGAHRALCPRCAKRRLFFDPFSPMAEATAVTTVFPCAGRLRFLLSPTIWTIN